MIVVNKSYVPHKVVGGSIKNILKKAFSNVDNISRDVSKISVGGNLISDKSKTMVKRVPIKFLG